METISGRHIDVFNLKVEDIYLGDMARGLSQINRFGGQTHGTIDVANHSTAMARWFYNRERFEEAEEALVHDSPEYILGSDIITPLKYAQGLEILIEVEKNILSTILKALDINRPISASVKELDSRMKVREARLLKPASELARTNVDVSDIFIWRQSPRRSERQFLAMYNKIKVKLRK